MWCLRSRAVTWKWVSNYSSCVSYQSCHFEVQSDKIYNVVIQNVKSKDICIFQIRKQDLVSITYNQINSSESIKLYGMPIFSCYRFMSLTCKSVSNTVSVQNAHLYHFLGGLLNTELPITRRSFKWLTAPYWHEINIRKGNGWPHWMIWRCE